jgi:thiosulfate/3-mercaptopyruvate sulfurtransferase
VFFSWHNDLMNPLVTAAWLQGNISNPDLRVVDTRFWLGQPNAGIKAYQAGHIAGAVFLDLEADLSSEKLPNGTGGRHPLPNAETLAAKLSSVGIGSDHLIVVYDDPSSGQGFYAAHLWWLLRYLGHDQVRVLNGGLPAWKGQLEMSTPSYAKAVFTVHTRPEMLVSAEDVATRDAKTVLIDARAPERFRGEVEPLDKKAGHIPQAINLPWVSALEHGFWKSSVDQAQRFDLENTEEIILYCGSGVSACANALSLEIAGIEGAKLYAGSWSDWISDDSRPVAVI